MDEATSPDLRVRIHPVHASGTRGLVHYLVLVGDLMKFVFSCPDPGHLPRSTRRLNEDVSSRNVAMDVVDEATSPGTLRGQYSIPFMLQGLVASSTTWCWLENLMKFVFLVPLTLPFAHVRLED